MANVNVNRNVADPFYRYKMPRLIAKVEGKGNGIKTVIVNMPDIAKALTRPPSYPTKFFGCELGAQTQFDSKNDRYIVNGDHDCHKLQEVLDGFIRKFVLCHGCENPETTLTIRNKQSITSHCKACGYTGTIDPKHKLTTFILKNPPTCPEEGLPAEEVKAEKKERKGKGKGDSSPTEEGEGEMGMGDMDLNDDNGSGVSEENEDDWPDADNIDEDDNRLTGRMATLTMHADLEKTMGERLDMFFAFVNKEKSAGNVDGKSVMIEAERLDIGAKAALLLARALLSPANVINDIDTYRSILVRACHHDQKAQKYLLGGVEQLIVDKNNRDELLAKVPHILKSLYDNDVLDEEVILDWGKKASKKYVGKEDSKVIHSKAEPFLAWLREAESETDESDEEGVQIEFHSSGKVASAVTNGVVHKRTEQEDLDIDDI